MFGWIKQVVALWERYQTEEVQAHVGKQAEATAKANEAWMEYVDQQVSAPAPASPAAKLTVLKIGKRKGGKYVVLQLDNGVHAAKQVELAVGDDLTVKP